MRAFYVVLWAVLTCLVGEVASAQTTDRSIDEIRTETLARSQTGAYPLLGIQPADATDALGRIKSRDPDEWAAAWSAVADGYMAKAKAASDSREADANFIKTWRLEPREAWINPAGGHMGRPPATWPDPVIFRKIILPWEVRRLSQKPDAPESPTR